MENGIILLAECRDTKTGHPSETIQYRSIDRDFFCLKFIHNYMWGLILGYNLNLANYIKSLLIMVICGIMLL